MMRYGNIAGIDKKISRLVQGTVPVDPGKPDESLALLDACWEQGCTAFDTAAVYGRDRSVLFGKWVRERGIRDQVVILAKGSHHNQDRPRVTPWDIGSDLHDTLAQMQVDYIDLYVLHRDDPAVPVGPIVEALNQFAREGKIKAFGGSNWTHDRVAEANAYAQAHNLTPFALSSPNFSLAEQVKEPWPNCVSISGPENENVRTYYREQNMPLFCWSSLAGGFFSGRVNRDNTGEFKGGLDKLAVECYAYPQNFQRLDRVEEIARQKNASVPQIALAYVMNYPLNIFALVGCRNGDEFRANVQALDITLTPQEMDYLDLKAPNA